MPAKLINVLMAVSVLGSLVVGSAIARSNIATSSDNQPPVAKVDLNQAVAEATAAPSREDADRAGSMMVPSSITSPMRAFLTKADFDQIFADATALPRRDNTPANREKLREAGWKRIIGSR
jgi:hypothetical protein